MKVSRKTFDEVMVPCYAPQEMVLTHGKGCYVFDSCGQKYLDLSAGIAVNCLGHAHKGVCEVIKKQSQKLMHVSNIFVNNQTLILAKKLCELTPFDKVFFVNSGAEANEAALKLARRIAFNDYGEEKCEIISFSHSFHGRTLFSVSVGGQAKYSSGFGPTPQGITHLEFNNLAALEQHISDKTCAVILEPIQGEGGILEADIEFLKGVRALCDKYHATLIFDEVQTGVGRTGSFYAFEQCGVTPDILTSAKGLAAGVPIGAMLTFERFAKHFTPGTHGSTFGGNALACAVGAYVVDKVSDPVFLAQVQKNGAYLKHQLELLGKKYDLFKEVRGKGLLLGAELNEQYQGQAGKLQSLCAKHHLLTLVAGANVLRLTPPLIISKHLIDEALGLLERAIIDFKALSNS